MCTCSIFVIYLSNYLFWREIFCGLKYKTPRFYHHFLLFPFQPKTLQKVLFIYFLKFLSFLKSILSNIVLVFSTVKSRFKSFLSCYNYHLFKLLFIFHVNKIRVFKLLFVFHVNKIWAIGLVARSREAC